VGSRAGGFGARSTGTSQPGSPSSARPAAFSTERWGKPAWTPPRCSVRMRSSTSAGSGPRRQADPHGTQPRPCRCPWPLAGGRPRPGPTDRGHPPRGHGGRLRVRLVVPGGRVAWSAPGPAGQYVPSEPAPGVGTLDDPSVRRAAVTQPRGGLRGAGGRPVRRRVAAARHLASPPGPSLRRCGGLQQHPSRPGPAGLPDPLRVRPEPRRPAGVAAEAGRAPDRAPAAPGRSRRVPRSGSPSARRRCRLGPP
jgi:hypothetical protein